MSKAPIAAAYTLAREAFAAQGVDTEAALTRLDAVPVSIHRPLGGPGRPRDPDALRAEVAAAVAQIPGPGRLALHAQDCEAGAPVEREAIRPEHFQRWVDWARELRLGLDFNASCCSDGPGEQSLTLSHPDPAIRRRWIDGCQASRALSAHLGRSLGTPSLLDLRVPDSAGEVPFDRLGPRRRLLEALDEVFATPIQPQLHRDAVEGELLGLGAAGTVGGSDFFLAYAVRRNIVLGVDAGRSRATELVSDRLWSALPFLDGVLLHLRSGVRQAGDRLVPLGDATQVLAHELVRGGVLDRVSIALECLDASTSTGSVAAWVVGVRDLRRALLRALLEPAAAVGEETLPWAVVWDHYCEIRGVPPRLAGFDAARAHHQGAAVERASPAPEPRASPSAYGGVAAAAAPTSAAERVFRSAETTELKASVCDIGRRLWQRAYVDGNGGNISVRVADDLVLCTPTLVSKGFMAPDDLCLVDLEGVQRAGAKRATSEILMHLAIYRVQPLARACVHAHPPYATGFAVSGVLPPSCLIPEMEVFCGAVPIAPYFTPGTHEVGEAVARLADLHNTILMGNHGAVGWGFDVQDAYFKMEILESYCRTVMVARQLGNGPNHFAPEQVRDLLAIKQRLGIPDARLPLSLLTRGEGGER